MKAKSTTKLVYVTSKKNPKESTLVLAKQTSLHEFHISKLMAQSAKRELNIGHGDCLVLANTIYRQQGYKLHIS